MKPALSSPLYWGEFFVINNAWQANLGDKSCIKVTSTQLDQEFSCHHNHINFLSHSLWISLLFDKMIWQSFQTKYNDHNYAHCKKRSILFKSVLAMMIWQSCWGNVRNDIWNIWDMIYEIYETWYIKYMKHDIWNIWGMIYEI